MDAPEPFDKEPLAVADTRPPLVPYIGVPFELALAIFVGSFAFANITHMMIAPFGCGIILMGAASFLVRRDYNGFRVLCIGARLITLRLSAGAWGGLAVNHYPRQARPDRDIPDAL